MLFRVLKFKPRRAARRGSGPVADHPPGAQPGHRLLLGGHRSRASCGSRSATPAGSCGTRPGRSARRATRSTAGTSWRAVAARSSRFLVHHAPQMPGRELPLTIALVELEEGVRMVADVRGNSRGPRHRRRRRRRLGPGRRRADPADLGGGPMKRTSHRHRAARVGAAGHADAGRLDGDRDARLPGRAPRPRPRAVARLEGHLREHPDHDRAGAEVRRRLGARGGRAGVRRPFVRAAARRPGAPLRHAELHRRRSPTTPTACSPSTWSAGCRCGDHVHREGGDRPMTLGRRSAARRRSPASARPSSPRSPAAPSCSSPARRPWRRSPTPGSRRPTSTA